MAGKNKNKTAKMAHNKKTVHEDTVASHLRIISGAGHLVAKSSDMTTVCGRRRDGWRYGVESDVTCKPCLEGENYVPASSLD